MTTRKAKSLENAYPERVYGQYSVEFTDNGWAVFQNTTYGATQIGHAYPGDEGKKICIKKAKGLYEQELEDFPEVQGEMFKDWS